MIIVIRNLQKKILIPKGRINKLILKTLEKEGVGKKEGVINLSFVDDKRMRKLNKKFLNKDRATDVLAFDLGQNKQLLADIIISADTAKKNAGIYKTNIDFELRLYAVHGILHLLGYKDKSKKQIKIMREKEREYVY